ncbi:hypothetical protein TRVL_05579 [Trypanosoma vivax]|nr:hypothetical protein TRVL_05579 [Trypanosoma vivax]
MQSRSTAPKVHAQSMNTAAVLLLAFVRRTAVGPCMIAPSVDRAARNLFVVAAACLPSLLFLTGWLTMFFISLHSLLVSATGRKVAMMFVGSSFFRSGCMVSWPHLADTYSARKLQAKSRKLQLIGSLPNFCKSSKRISSLPNAVLEDSSRSATSIPCSVMGLNVFRLVFSIFIRGPYCCFVGVSIYIWANAYVRRLLSIG